MLAETDGGKPHTPASAALLGLASAASAVGQRMMEHQGIHAYTQETPASVKPPTSGNGLLILPGADAATLPPNTAPVDGEAACAASIMTCWAEPTNKQS